MPVSESYQRGLAAGRDPFENMRGTLVNLMQAKQQREDYLRQRDMQEAQVGLQDLMGRVQDTVYWKTTDEARRTQDLLLANGFRARMQLPPLEKFNDVRDTEAPIWFAKKQAELAKEDLLPEDEDATLLAIEAEANALFGANYVSTKLVGMHNVTTAMGAGAPQVSQQPTEGVTAEKKPTSGAPPGMPGISIPPTVPTGLGAPTGPPRLRDLFRPYIRKASRDDLEREFENRLKGIAIIAGNPKATPGALDEAIEGTYTLSQRLGTGYTRDYIQALAQAYKPTAGTANQLKSWATYYSQEIERISKHATTAMDAEGRTRTQRIALWRVLQEAEGGDPDAPMPPHFAAVDPQTLQQRESAETAVGRLQIAGANLGLRRQGLEIQTQRLNIAYNAVARQDKNWVRARLAALHSERRRLSTQKPPDPGYTTESKAMLADWRESQRQALADIDEEMGVLQSGAPAPTTAAKPTLSGGKGKTVKPKQGLTHDEVRRKLGL